MAKMGFYLHLVEFLQKILTEPAKARTFFDFMIAQDYMKHGAVRTVA